MQTASPTHPQRVEMHLSDWKEFSVLSRSLIKGTRVIISEWKEGLVPEGNKARQWEDPLVPFFLNWSRVGTQLRWFRVYDTSIQQLCTLRCAHHKCSSHLSPSFVEVCFTIIFLGVKTLGILCKYQRQCVRRDKYVSHLGKYSFSCVSFPLPFVYSSSCSFSPTLHFLFSLPCWIFQFCWVWVCPEEMELLVEYVPAESTARVLILKRTLTGSSDTFSGSPKAVPAPKHPRVDGMLKSEMTHRFSTHTPSIALAPALYLTGSLSLSITRFSSLRVEASQHRRELTA